MSSGTASRHACGSCGAKLSRWSARCPHCLQWTSGGAATPQEDRAPSAPPRTNESIASAPHAPKLSLVSEDAGQAPPRTQPSTPVPITEVGSDVEPRTPSGIAPLDDVLGGGLVVGSLILLGGDPGAGKSTLLSQLMGRAPCERLLYATGEESTTQVAMRARRLRAAHERIRIVRETDIDVVIAHAVDLRPEILAIDSIQTLVDSGVAGAPGSVAQVRSNTQRLMDFAHTFEITTILIGHVTKEGAIAGPKTLEHMVDVSLHLEKPPESQVRILRAHKNRYGSTAESGWFQMTDGGLEPSEPADAGAPVVDEFLPIAQELLHRYLEMGGELDAGLADRIGGRLDASPRPR